jgi:uncharacterized membrane protein (UPF0127 family)
MKDGDRVLFVVPSGSILKTELVITTESKKKGLMFRKRLPPGEGMFFYHADEPRRRSMWMPNMKFPLDIIWLDGNLKIVSIRANVQPCPSTDECPSISSIVKCQHAIELPAGSAEDFDLEVGQILRLL